MTTNTLELDGVRAVISFDPEIEMFRGEFLGLNGGADFYAGTVKQLKIEGRKSLKVFLEMCEEDKVDPYKNFSGKFIVRVSPALHLRAVTAAKAKNQSLNALAEEAIKKYIE